MAETISAGGFFQDGARFRLERHSPLELGYCCNHQPIDAENPQQMSRESSRIFKNLRDSPRWKKPVGEIGRGEGGGWGDGRRREGGRIAGSRAMKSSTPSNDDNSNHSELNSGVIKPSDANRNGEKLFHFLSSFFLLLLSFHSFFVWVFNFLKHF